MSCCLCGGNVDVKHCPLCGHDFDKKCRDQYFERGLAAVKAFITRKPPRHCRGHEEGS